MVAVGRGLDLGGNFGFFGSMETESLMAIVFISFAFFFSLSAAYPFTSIHIHIPSTLFDSLDSMDAGAGRQTGRQARQQILSRWSNGVFFSLVGSGTGVDFSVCFYLFVTWTRLLLITRVAFCCPSASCEICNYIVDLVCAL
ncbi:hypothetical protein B0H66DRAFT_237469 [Apodospora peruviana]|uniref:Uncharacterized protein n=1 Tax=Apodospora peruviana TaxID=516989 RepID=A0AAE0M3W7_9PEZI|nr:hypothetical protein B0H66DRAFT_237469 [Apodospora peruviana]